MRFIILLLSVSSAISFGATFHKVPSSLEKFTRACRKVEESLFDFYACPKIERFQYKAAADLKKLPDFLKSKGLEPVASNAEAAVKVIEESISSPIGAVSEIRPGLETEDLEIFDKAFSKYRTVTSEFLVAITAAAKNADEVFVDDDTYWAPSVNARAMVLVNKEKKGVTIVWHGDTDG